MRTTILLIAICFSSICYAVKVKKGEFERIAYYIKVQGSPTGTGFQYVVYDSDGYTHTLTTIMDEKIAVWSYYGGDKKRARSSIAWDIYPKKVKAEIKKDEETVDGFYTYINKTISSKIKVRR